MLGYLQLDRIHVIFVNEIEYQKNVHRCHITSVLQTNQYLKDKRESFTLVYSMSVPFPHSVCHAEEEFYSSTFRDRQCIS